MHSLRQTIAYWNLRELANPPNLLSLLRIPMALMVWQVARDPIALLMLAALAGLTDVLDGYAARSMPKMGPPDEHKVVQRQMGDWLDPLCDKIFVASAVMAAAFYYRPEPQLLFLILFRDLVQSLLFLLVAPMLWRHRVHLNFRANRWGKMTTVLQFVALIAMIFSSKWLAFFAYASACFGFVAVWVYVQRGLRKWQQARPARRQNAQAKA